MNWIEISGTVVQLFYFPVIFFPYLALLLISLFLMLKTTTLCVKFLIQFVSFQTIIVMKCVMILLLIL